jgi:hypothetical protein
MARQSKTLTNAPKKLKPSRTKLARAKNIPGAELQTVLTDEDSKRRRFRREF